MSEQYPLLCDDHSEEDQLSPRFHRRLLMSRGRARNQVNGAAAIITRWPEHWTTSLKYLWIVISMLALTTLFTYNLISSYAMLEPTHKYHPKSIHIKPSETVHKLSLPPKVFMHIIVNDKQEVDLNNYLPYIEIIANKYKRFKYELVIIGNDTNVDMKEMTDKENNEFALNMLWADESKVLTNISNLDIKYTTLSKYFYNSPLKKYRKHLPHHLVKFLVRAVSIWEKGGIAFDPVIITPQSPNSVYIDKVSNILMNYKVEKNKAKTLSKSAMQYTSSKKMNKIKYKPNNIRDIINALEHESYIDKPYQEPLAEAEAKDNLISILERKQRSTDNVGNKQNKMKPIESKDVINIDVNTLPQQESISHTETTKEKQLENTSKLNLLPLFLDFLFHNKQTKHLDETTTNTEIKHEDNLPKDISKNYENKSLHMRNFWSELTDKDNIKPIIISAKGIIDKPFNKTTVEKEIENPFEVTIDLKGNIIATETACHAFIGNMFSNAISHDQTESVTDFITKELTIFCNGVFASCVGIDVILL